MTRDPIVEEVRQARQKLLASCEGDLDKLMDRLQLAEEQDRNRVVTLESLRQKR